jgi:hypothetical protein
MLQALVQPRVRPWLLVGLGRDSGLFRGAGAGAQAQEGTDMDIGTIEDHILQAGEKLKDLTEVHLPAIEEFVSALAKNPLVIGLASVVPGGLSADAMALLNELPRVLSASRQAPPDPAPGAPSPVPGDAATGTAASTPAAGEAQQ